MKFLLSTLFSLLCFTSLSAQDYWKANYGLPIGTDTLFGTLLLPDSSFGGPVVLLISGSGPTDRNGNNPSMINNSLKMLADSLCAAGIGSFRYDKRGIAASAGALPEKEDNLLFETYINDAVLFVLWLKATKQFSRVIVAGHSEGSLLGMIAANFAEADGFISLAGAGRPADQLLRKQFESQPPALAKEASVIMDTLKTGLKVTNISPVLASLFRPSIQPYLISWFRYDPAVEIAKLHCPVMIVQGTTDIQVEMADAQMLSDAVPKAQFEKIEGMNHIFKPADPDRGKNIQTYMDPNLPIIPGFTPLLIKFIKGI